MIAIRHIAIMLMVCIALLTGNESSCQDSGNSDQISQWQFGISVAIGETAKMNMRDFSELGVKIKEQHRYVPSGGIEAGYYFSEKASLFSGIFLTDKGYRLFGEAFGEHWLHGGPVIFYYLDIPLFIRYDFLAQDRFNFFVKGGPISNIYLFSEGHVSQPDNFVLTGHESIITYANHKPISVSAGGSFGVEWSLNHAYNINTEFFLTHGLMEFQKADSFIGFYSLKPVLEYTFIPYFIGISFGINRIISSL